MFAIIPALRAMCVEPVRSNTATRGPSSRDSSRAAVLASSVASRPIMIHHAAGSRLPCPWPSAALFLPDRCRQSPLVLPVRHRHPRRIKIILHHFTAQQKASAGKWQDRRVRRFQAAPQPSRIILVGNMTTDSIRFCPRNRPVPVGNVGSMDNAGMTRCPHS